MRRIWPLGTKRRNNGERSHARPVDPDAGPDFLCIGAFKGGTSWLYQQLRAHPDFWMPPLKELNYFNQISRALHPDRAARRKLPMRDERDLHFREVMESLCTQKHLDLERYAQLFAAKGPLLSGDITPSYSIVPEEVIERIVKRFPDLKVVFLARDPVERAWSELSMAVRHGGIQPFDVTNCDEVTRNLLHPDIVLRSHPSKIVARWRRHVRPGNFRIFFFDDLATNPVEVRRSIVAFLGGDPNKSNDRVRPDQKFNEGVKKLRLTEPVRSHVAQFFEKELTDCAQQLGGRAREWPVRYGLLSILWWLLQMAFDYDFLIWS